MRVHPVLLVGYYVLLLIIMYQTQLVFGIAVQHFIVTFVTVVTQGRNFNIVLILGGKVFRKVGRLSQLLYGWKIHYPGRIINMH